MDEDAELFDFDAAVARNLAYITEAVRDGRSAPPTGLEEWAISRARYERGEHIARLRRRLNNLRTRNRRSAWEGQTHA